MTIWRYKVQTTVYSSILDVFTVESTFSLVILVKLSVYIINYWFPAVIDIIYSHVVMRNGQI